VSRHLRTDKRKQTAVVKCRKHVIRREIGELVGLGAARKATAMEEQIRENRGGRKILLKNDGEEGL